MMRYSFEPIPQKEGQAKENKDEPINKEVFKEGGFKMPELYWDKPEFNKYETEEKNKREENHASLFMVGKKRRTKNLLYGLAILMLNP